MCLHESVAQVHPGRIYTTPTSCNCTESEGECGIECEVGDYLDEDFPKTDGRRAELSQKQNTLEEISFALPPELTHTQERKLLTRCCC